jgi:uracil-DNA glycosylase family 4|tara:strand:+ start:321 stop:995 length:675 start_codon:yes stop_codon:yes gene_type:complete
MSIKFKKMNKTIINCKKCPRLINFSRKISIKKRKQNINEVYWGKPVPGFGDLEAKIMIVGLAPAAHGGTRTGRAFTGDKSGDFLFKCLHYLNISNQSFSVSLNDGLKLKSTYITNILKCVPPDDKPLSIELINCSNFFKNEISNLKKLKVIVAMGKVSFDNCIKFYKSKYILNKKFTFKHGSKYILPDNKVIFASYHPSPRNVNTKLITLKKMISLFKKVKKII